MKTGHDERTRHLSRWVVAGMILVSVAYLWMLGCRGKEREADLLVLYTSGPDRPAPVHPETSIPLWASPEQVQAEVERIRQHRAEQDLPTVVVSARPDTNTARVVDVGGHRVLVLEISGAERSFAVAREALVSGLQGPPADLTVVATSLPAGDVWDHLSGPLAVLPGGYSADVPEGVEVKAEGRLVAPWVDSRYRLGELRVDFDQPLALEGRAVELRSGAARPDGDTLIGVGSDALSYDAIHFHQGGLGKVIAQQMVERTGADLALVNYLSVRHDLVGPVDIVRLQAALPFHNQVELLTLTGAQILALLQPNTLEDTRYLLVGGLRQDPEGRWLDSYGQPLRPGTDYRVATLDYLASGARGRRPIFLEGRDRVRTGLYTDLLLIDLLLATRQDAG